MSDRPSVDFIAGLFAASVVWVWISWIAHQEGMLSVVQGESTCIQMPDKDQTWTCFDLPESSDE